MVTIIMPVYNGEEYIAQAIDSVLAQTYPHWELIVVDDGSTDNTATIVRSYRGAGIRYTYQENQGQAAALNHGLELSTGDYVTTLDADDWLTRDSLAVRIHWLAQKPAAGAVYCDGYFCNSEGKQLATFADYRPGNLTGDVYDVLIRTNFLSAGSAVMIRKDIFDKQELWYDESIVWCQDWDLYIRVAEMTTFGYVDRLGVCYRLQSGNMTMSMPASRKLDSVIRMRNKVLSSARFTGVALGHKEAFFQNYLTQTLQERVKQRREVLASRQFQALPCEVRGRLLRLTANSHLLEGGDADDTRQWLDDAHSAAPSDIKTGVARFLLHVHPGLARGALSMRQSLRPRRRLKSPLEMAATSFSE